MCGGGGKQPKVDTSFQDYSIAESERARKEAEARQNRIDYGMELIKTIFEGGRAPGTKKASSGGYDAKQTYYLADGTVWTPKAQTTKERKVLVTPATPGRRVTTPASPATPATPGGRVTNPAPTIRSPYWPVPQTLGGWYRDPDGDYRQDAGPFARSEATMWASRPYYDSDGDLRFDSGSFARSDAQAYADGPYRDPDGDIRYHTDYNAGAPTTTSWVPGTAAVYKTVKDLVGPTAAEQFEKLRDSLLILGAGKKHAGMAPILKARREAMEGYYLPQLDESYDDTSDQLTFALARAGLLGSTSASTRASKLNEGFKRERASIMSDIAQDASATRTAINQQRGQLESQLRASGDASAAINAALDARGAFAVDQPTLDPIGNVLLGFAEGIGAAGSGYNTGRIQRIARGGAGSSPVFRDLSRVVA